MLKKKYSKTCIAAIKHRGKVIMAADRQVTWDDGQKQVMVKPKVFKRGGLLLAATGDGYLCTLLVERLGIPTMIADLNTYIFEVLYKKIHDLLIKKGYTSDDKRLAIPKDSCVELIVGIKGRVFTFELSDSGILEADEVNLPYATGCGGSYAWGSLLTTRELGIGSPRDKLTLALTIASQVSAGCDDNIDIIGE